MLCKLKLQYISQYIMYIFIPHTNDVTGKFSKFEFYDVLMAQNRLIWQPHPPLPHAQPHNQSDQIVNSSSIETRSICSILCSMQDRPHHQNGLGHVSIDCIRLDNFHVFANFRKYNTNGAVEFGSFVSYFYYSVQPQFTSSRDRLIFKPFFPAYCF